jgi:hypothetical protein
MPPLSVCLREVAPPPCERAGVALEAEVWVWGGEVEVAWRWLVDGREVQAGRTASVGDGPTRHLLLLARDDQRHTAIFEASAGGAVARQGWEGVVASPQCPFDLRAEVVLEPGVGLVGVVRNAGPAPSPPGTARWLAGGRRWAESQVPALAAGEMLELVVPVQQVAEMVREVQAGRSPAPVRRRQRRPSPSASLPAGARVVLLAPLPEGDLNPRDNAFEVFVTASLTPPP